MGFIVKAVKAVGKVIGKVVKVIGGIFGFSVKPAKTEASHVNNLTKSIDPEASRKIVFGNIAAPLDERFWEVWGAEDTNFDEVIAVATHRINAVKELYIENDLAINAAGVVQTKFSGLLTRTSALGNQSTALAVGSGTLWTSAAKFDGCAHIKLSWLVDEKRLPNGIPSRYTQVIEGALLYDPRKDSTRGGSGTHRADDQNTWSYSALDSNGQPIGINNALQALWYLLGWRITNPVTGEQVLVAGRGVDPNDINMASFIAGANACEAAQYYTAMCLSTDDEHTTNENKITCDGLIARLIDPGGLWSYYANVDDTANIAVDLTDDDIADTGSIDWLEYKGMSDQFNQVTGKYIMPDTIALFQPFPYPMVRDAVYEANLGRKVRKTQDFQQVFSSDFAQKLARLLLNSGQYQGEFKAEWKMRALKAQAWSVVRYTSEYFGWTKLFRVWRHEINPLTGVSMLLKEIDPSIWTAGTVANAFGRSVGARLDNALTSTVLNFTVQNVSVSSGSPALIQDAMTISWTLPNSVSVDRTELRYKIGAGNYTYLPPISRDTGTSATMLVPVAKGASYTLEARHINRNALAGPWAVVTITAGIAGNWVTTNSTVISMIDPATGRIMDPFMYNTGAILSIENTSNIAVTYTVGGSNVTVNIPLHVRKITSTTGAYSITYNAGSFVVPFSSYWIAYIDDPTLTGDTVGAGNYVYTTNPDDLLATNRYFVASGTSPSSGGTGGSSGGGGGGGGFGGGVGCVFVDSFMANGLRANQVMPNDVIKVLDESFLDTTQSKVTSNKIHLQPCVKLTCESNFSVIVSESTPCTLFGGDTVLAPDTFGKELAVEDERGLRWEKIIKVENVGILPVAHISCNEGTYAAGCEFGKLIYTHNLGAKP